jgi:hypothetical protein
LRLRAAVGVACRGARRAVSKPGRETEPGDGCHRHEEASEADVGAAVHEGEYRQAQERTDGSCPGAERVCTSPCHGITTVTVRGEEAGREKQAGLVIRGPAGLGEKRCVSGARKQISASAGKSDRVTSGPVAGPTSRSWPSAERTEMCTGPYRSGSAGAPSFRRSSIASGCASTVVVGSGWLEGATLSGAAVTAGVDAGGGGGGDGCARAGTISRPRPIIATQEMRNAARCATTIRYFRGAI